MDFEWDDRKNAANFEKHGVWFEEAATVVVHTLSKEFEDPDHPERTISIGYSNQMRTLFVVYIEKKTAYRIISARPATPKERKEYEEGI